MGFCIPKVKVTREQVQGLRARGVQNGGNEIVSGLTSECAYFVVFVDEASNEKTNDDEGDAECI